MSILKRYPQLTKIYSPTLLKSHQHSRFTRKFPTQRGTIFYLNKTASVLHLSPREIKPSVRFYCTSSSSDGVKATAPVGVLEATPDSHLSRLGGRIGQSFHQLSTHINMYFQRKNDVPPAESANLKTVQRVTRAQRHIRRVAQQLDMPQRKEAIRIRKETRPPPLQEDSGVQLFHNSSLASKFGESYNYVANHINSAFSRAGTKDDLDLQSKSLMNKRGNIKNNTTNMQTQTFISWEDGYTLFAAHINRYFGAGVTDKEKTVEHIQQRQTFIATQAQTFDSKDGSQGLFHSSHNTTHFGESHFQMANHINQYFHSETAADQDMGEDFREMDPAFVNPGEIKSVSLMDCLRHPSNVPDFVSSYLRPTQAAPKMTSPTARWNKNVSLP